MAWSLKGNTDAMVIRVSPAGKTLRMAGSAGMVLGGSVDALVNDRYRQVINEAAGEWNSAETVEGIVANRLQSALGPDLVRVATAGSTAGFSSAQKADQARYGGLEKQGFETLLDIDMSHGLFGPQAQPVVVLNSRVIDLARGTLQWQEQLVSTTSPVLVTDPLRSPIERLKPTIADPRLRVEAEAVQELVRDGAAPLKHEMETAAEAAAAMLLTALRVEESYAGHYQLGRSALYTKKLEAAVQHFERALALRPGAPEATNALAVTRAHQGDRAAALEMSRALADSAPDFAPVHYNVAWWLTEAGEMRQAAVYYQKAQQLGLVDANLEKRLHGAP